jgi:hypothetical protein
LNLQNRNQLLQAVDVERELAGDVNEDVGVFVMEILDQVFDCFQGQNIFLAWPELRPAVVPVCENLPGAAWQHSWCQSSVISISN